ncbi:Vegetative incompatibility [Lecanosticta acicola]|uniref:Vegetative incompatibility n=1 Tax=Lecanosticta acicola TaxID=111012 RepID=A0AAI8YTY3_9PEZI|nr:Vegetative incompatibility [Lecanosticta acicola]
MRLLSYDSCDELQVSRDRADDDAPPYAILSHTWGADDEEITFADLTSDSYQSKVGYRKIEFSITCMYRWYRNARVCYVYLADVASADCQRDPEGDPADIGLDKLDSGFRRSRWFTRGWTLQELLAPKEVVFYSKEGDRLGTKKDLTDLLHEITGIPNRALTGEPLSNFSVDERMHWAQARSTKEPEDRAYCLLGIFNVCMSLRYGEGDDAFKRLRRKIDGPKLAQLDMRLNKASPIHRGIDEINQTLAQNSLVVPSFSLQLLDIVQDNHPLVSASIEGDLAALQDSLASRDASLLCSTATGWTPLHFAAAYGHIDTCRFLIAQGASLHATGVRGISALHLAAHFGHVRVFKLLVQAGIDPDESHEHGLNAIFEILSIGARCAPKNLAGFLKWLLHGQEQFPFDVDAKDNSHRGVLYHLANPPDMAESSRSLTVEQVSAIDYVLKSGARSDELDVYGDSLLHEACRDERMDLVDALLRGSCDINCQDERGYTALHYAVESGNLPLASMLTRKGALVDVGIGEGQDGIDDVSCWQGLEATPLSLATERDDLDMIRLLTQNGAHRKDNHVTSALYRALSYSRRDMVDYLLTHAKDRLDLRFAIIHAAKVYPEMIETFFNAGAPLDESGEDGWTALQKAARWGELKAVETLVKLGAELNEDSGGHGTALWLAVEEGHAGVVSVLLRAGAHIDLSIDDMLSHDNMPFFMLASPRGSREISDLVLSYIPDALDERDEDQPLHDEQYNSDDLACSASDQPLLDEQAACGEGDLDMVERLLEQGCDLDNHETCRALEAAIRHKHWQIATALVEAGVGLNYYGEYDSKPIIEAVDCANLPLVELMICHGADVNIQDEYGTTPLVQCLLYADPLTKGTMVRALLGGGARVDAVDDDGCTPLGLASSEGDLDAVIALVEGGANLDVPSRPRDSFDGRYMYWPPLASEVMEQYRTPLAWAARNGHESVVRYLFDSGADWRSLRKEPAVWYTHRLLMESAFPEAGRKVCRAKDGSPRTTSRARKDADHEPTLQTAFVDAEPEPQSRIQPTHNSSLDVARPKGKLGRAFAKLCGWLQTGYAHLQLARLEVATLTCVLFLLTLRQAFRHITNHGVQSLRLAVVAMLVGWFLAGWMNDKSVHSTG